VTALVEVLNEEGEDCGLYDCQI